MLLTKLQQLQVDEGSVAICFLGQAGFLFKSASEQYVIIDPYFSNVCEERIGPAFKRLMPSLIDPEQVDELKLAAYLMTHHHEDHLDPVGIVQMNNKAFTFYAPPASIDCLKELDIPTSRCIPIAEGDTVRIGDDLTIHAVFADHGELAPDAVGLVIEMSGTTIYHMGDTCYDAEAFHRIADTFDIDLVIAPINGKFGNMDETDAVKAAEILNPKCIIPCHFWMLPGNSGGDVAGFLEQMREKLPHIQPRFMTLGEITLLR
ncbi:MBL fold metallo-hydrolase [Paenibacillus mendelii]|uniref:MBL fold metallo-hydrolase n=1 Tax=Paenibacillus mendelii TaxID=206163 RepID=A0ABV6JF61_9BACL|nr:MBL fold metallo-hydrolase [Paenibacillus mendelii]MCQ6557429.1 MBL fold metallo-hydrolase [Paenibacillus mendelii]